MIIQVQRCKRTRHGAVQLPKALQAIKGRNFPNFLLKILWVNLLCLLVIPKRPWCVQFMLLQIAHSVRGRGTQMWLNLHAQLVSMNTQLLDEMDTLNQSISILQPAAAALISH